MAGNEILKKKTFQNGFFFKSHDLYLWFIGLPWYKKILNLTLPEPRDININPKNCIGTVLSLNGHRRYFCMYHAKHPEGSRKKIYTANNGAVGKFTLVWWLLWNFIIRQMKFNRFLHPNEPLQRIFLYLVRLLEAEPSKIGHNFTK